jgi:hypothetical protein
MSDRHRSAGIGPAVARRLGSALVAITSLLASSTAAQAAVGTTPSTPVLMVGDSVLAALGNPLLAQLNETHSVSIEAATCRRTLAPSCPYQGTRPRTGVEVLQAHTPVAGELWVMALGYNDDPSVFADGIDAVMDEADRQGVRTVIWLTLRSPNGRFDRANRALREASTSHPGLRVADWNSAAAGHANWFGSDGVHPTSGGATALTNFLATEIAQALASRCAVSTRSRLDTAVTEPAVSDASRFIAASPTRVLDTRVGDVALQADGVITLTVASPDTASAATAVVLNVTAVQPCGPGYITVFPCGATRPLVSNLNLTAGRTVANQVVVRPDAEGTVCLYSTVGTDLVVDVFGSYSGFSGAGLRPARPERVLDTRVGLGAPRAKLVDPNQITLRLAGTSGMALDAQAVVLNVTATDALDEGYVTVFPCGQERPVVSSLNFETGRTVANLVTVRLGFGGAVCFYANQAVDLVADVSGAFVDNGDLYRSASPWRHLDTRVDPRADTRVDSRVDTRRVAAGKEIVVPMAGVGAIARDATAVAFNLTAVNPSGPGFLSAYPCGSARPPSSNVNYGTGENVPNLAVVQVGTAGAICISSFADADVVVDVAGWYVPAGTVVIGP